MDFIMKKISENKQIEFNNLINWFLSKKSAKENLQSDYKWFLNTVSKNIIFYYQDFKKLKIKNLKKITIKLKKYDNTFVKKFDINSKKKNELLIREVKKLNNYLSFFIVHGSYATNDFIINWSDFDSVAVIKDKVLKDYKLLNEFRIKMIALENLLNKIDSFQHHGFLFMTEFDLNHYSSNFLPINVLEHSRVVTDKKILKLKYYREKKFWVKKFLTLNNLFKKSFNQGFLEHHPLKGKYLHDNFKDLNTMYQMKYFLSLIMFIPCLYLECIGRPTYKKYSFKKLYDLNLRIDYELLEKASLIRSMSQNNFFKSNKIPKWLLKVLGKNYFKRAHKLTDQLKKNLNKT